jgi:hypothetical protein
MTKSIELRLDITDKIDAIQESIYKDSILDGFEGNIELNLIDAMLDQILQLLELEFNR